MSNFTIYIASKTKHAPRWRELRGKGFPIISTWIDEADKGQTYSWSDLWTRCVNEAKSATCLIFYKEEGENLEGGYVEVGAALAANKKVYIVGKVKTFFNHPNVVVYESIEQLLSDLTVLIGMEDKVKNKFQPIHSMTVEKGQIWKHYKGGEYTIVAVGRLEVDLTPMVVYKSDDGSVWIRPRHNFLQTVKVIGQNLDGSLKTIERFVRIT